MEVRDMGWRQNMIQKATIADLPEVAVLLEEFRGLSRFLDGDQRVFIQSWTGLLNSDVGVIFMQREAGKIVGLLGGVAYPDVNTGRLVATEFFWFVRESARGGGLRLYKDFERWAQARGCQTIQMVHLLDVQPERMERLYHRMGFSAVETHYMKAL